MAIKKFFKKDELKLLLPFYVGNFISAIFFIVLPFEILYFLNIGLNLFQIGIITSAITLSSFLFEIPTGAIADIYGRKTSTIIGHFLVAISTLLLFFTTNFYWIIGLYFLWGFALTFISGASEAWIIDKLHQNRKRILIHDYYAKSHSFYNAGLLISGILGAFLVSKFGLSIIWPITSLHILLPGLIFLFVSEKHKKKKANFRKHYQNLLKQTNKSISYSFSHQNLRLFMIAIIFIGLSIVMFSGLTWYPLLEEMGLQEAYFGYLFSLTCALGIIAPYFTKSIVNYLGGYRKYLITIRILIITTTLIILLTNNLIFLIIIFIITSILSKFHIMGKKPFFQKFIPSKMRATISSLEVQIFMFIAIFGRILTGFLLEKIGAQYTIALGAIFSIPLIIIYSRLKENI